MSRDVKLYTAMRGILRNISRSEEPNAFDVSVSIGDETPKTYRVTYERSEERGQRYICWNDGGLLLAITKLGDRGLVDNWFYEHEIMLILFAFERGEPIPRLPVELGTTSFWRPPSLFRIFRNRIMRFLHRRGLFLKRLPPGRPRGENANEA